MSRRDEVTAILRRKGAIFAYVFGSVAQSEAQGRLGFEVAAYFPSPSPASFEITLPTGVDLLVLNSAPLELAGRVALEGVLLFEDDPAERVHWEATTRKIYLDERFRIERGHREFLESITRRSPDR